MPAVFLVSRTSPRNGSPLLHRTVILANSLPRLELSGILTFGGVIVTSSFGPLPWRAGVSQVRPAVPLGPAVTPSGGVIRQLCIATGSGWPAPADAARNTPASPTSCFIPEILSFHRAIQHERKQGRLPNRRW